MLYLTPTTFTIVNNNIAIFPGSFDPFTKGHLDIVQRALPLFDKIIIAIGVNSSKKRSFSTELMVEKIEGLFKKTNKIEVKTYEGLTALFAKKEKANYLLRGLRNGIDLEYESPISQANQLINNEVESVFLISKPELAFISSSIVRDLHRYEQDVSELLPYSL
jgi:pantetheine-phosphate adenylyltransferase